MFFCVFKGFFVYVGGIGLNGCGVFFCVGYGFVGCVYEIVECFVSLIDVFFSEIMYLFRYFEIGFISCYFSVFQGLGKVGKDFEIFFFV